MADEKVKIQYVHPSLLSKWGAKPITVSMELAKKYKDKGFAIILGEKAQTNIIPEKESEDEPVENYVRDKFISKVAWISTNYIDKLIKDVGKLCGFSIWIISPNSFSINLILKSDIIILSPTIFDFPQNQIVQIKSILFQQEKKYILYVDKDYDYSNRYKHLLIRSDMNVYTDEDRYNIIIDDLGSLLNQDRMIYNSRSKVYDFWNSIGKTEK